VEGVYILLGEEKVVVIQGFQIVFEKPGGSRVIEALPGVMDAFEEFGDGHGDLGGVGFPGACFLGGERPDGDRGEACSEGEGEGRGPNRAVGTERAERIHSVHQFLWVSFYAGLAGVAGLLRRETEGAAAVGSINISYLSVHSLGNLRFEQGSNEVRMGFTRFHASD
jgi:hypothetical protein